MQRTAARRWRWAGLAVAAALAACGPETPEEQLADAREQLEETRGRTQELEEEVTQRREAVARAEEALARARDELSAAESDLTRARSRIDQRATQVALFRAVQSALLEHDALEQFAIRVEVEGDSVTLRGVVDSRSQADAALETARETPGVAQVVDEIRVRGTAPERG